MDSVETIQCPYCWQEITIHIEPVIGAQELVEDCQVCCRPIELRITLSESMELTIDVVTASGHE